MNDDVDSNGDPASPLSQPAPGGFLSPFNQALADQARPVVRRLRELLPDIEEAMSKGYTRANIVQALKAEGIEISVSVLSTYLQRLRQRRPPPPTQPASGALVSPATPEAGAATLPEALPGDKQARGGARS